ncbi:MAG TPA: hypothetical protein VEE84_09260 [Burkholderiaceae bacterium]|nr:hypothetical protein [Burkholderiaceae bacterium]
MIDNATLIDSCKHLYLRLLEEPEANALRLIIEEVIGSDQIIPDTAEPDSSLPTADASSTAGERAQGGRIFEVSWRSYIAYCVRNESYARSEPKGNGKGRVFIKHTRSSYLDYLSVATLASDLFPAIFPRPIEHWAIYCLNHAVDVASIYEPEIIVRGGA